MPTGDFDSFEDQIKELQKYIDRSLGVCPDTFHPQTTPKILDWTVGL